MAQVRISFMGACAVSLIALLASRWINGETGLRSDVPHNMIYPLKETHPNLHIATGLHVKYVTFDKYVIQLENSGLYFWH